MVFQQPASTGGNRWRAVPSRRERPGPGAAAGGLPRRPPPPGFRISRPHEKSAAHPVWPRFAAGRRRLHRAAMAAKEMLEAAHMAGYHKKPGPKARSSLTGRFHEGPKTQSAGHNARLFFYPFPREMQQDFVAFAKKNTAFGVSVHMLPTVLSTFGTRNPCSQTPGTPP